MEEARNEAKISENIAAIESFEGEGFFTVKSKSDYPSFSEHKRQRQGSSRGVKNREFGENGRRSNEEDSETVNKKRRHKNRRCRPFGPEGLAKAVLQNIF